MITRLRLQNFRRHEQTEIALAPDEQIVVVGGGNGAGKTSILEAIQFALYGQGRHGARRLDTLVRRGGEVEGMEVELEFTVGDDTWRVVRRRDGKSVSALLFANDNAVVEGTRPVTDAVTQLLGMDAAGFRLAAVAQQKELDALVRMERSARVRAVGRLLRLDAVASARDDVRARHRRTVDVLDALGPAGNADDAAASAAEAEAHLAAARAAEAECRAAVAAAEADLNASVDVETAYQQARETLSAANATLAAAEAELQRCEAARDTHTVPQRPDGTWRDPLDIDLDATSVERDIAKAESIAQIAAQRRMLAGELAKADARMVAIADELEGRTVATVTGRISELNDALDGAERQVGSAVDGVEGARAAHATARADEQAALRRVNAFADLGGTCDTCGQDIPDAHRGEMCSAAETSLRQAQTAEAGAREALTTARAALEAAEGSRAAVAAALHSAEVELGAVATLEGELSELRRRGDVYSEQLARLPLGDADVDELYARKGELAVEAVAARAAADAVQQWEAAVLRHAELEMAVADAVQRRDAAASSVNAAAIPDDLRSRWEARRDAAERHRHQLELLGELAANTASAAAHLAAAEKTHRSTVEAQQRRGEHQERGTVEGLTVRVLTELESRLGANVRPALAGAMGVLLAQLSNGRFTDAKVSADYAPLVLDDGDYRPLADLSGGEQDIVALAMRLAIAEIVTQRHDGGVGFLILDEPLGGQDTQRRDAVLACLRGLRNRYGQIWAISHVGGIEDAADRVIDIEVDDNGIARVV
jgi:DNA repair protein SbcC/Rad50